MVGGSLINTSENYNLQGSLMPLDFLKAWAVKL